MEADKQPGKSAGRRTGQLPQDTYEKWLKKQVVVPSEKIPEGKMPFDFYEVWLRKQVRRHLRSGA